MKTKISLFGYSYKTDHIWSTMSVSFLDHFPWVKGVFNFKIVEFVKKKSCKLKFMLLKLKDLNIIRKISVKIRHPLDNQASESFCQNSIIHEVPGFYWDTLWPQWFSEMCTQDSSNPNFSGTQRLVSSKHSVLHESFDKRT